jgi:hypothetical protein
LGKILIDSNEKLKEFTALKKLKHPISGVPYVLWDAQSKRWESHAGNHWFEVTCQSKEENVDLGEKGNTSQ